MLLRVILENVARLFLLLASGLIALAFLELLAQIFGRSIVGDWYSPGRLLEISAILAVFAIALILREIRDELRANRQLNVNRDRNA